MTTIEERTPLDHTDWLLGQLADTLGRAAKLAEEMADALGHRTGPSAVLGVDPGRGVAVLASMPVAEVPVDGSVEVRPVGGQGRFGPWVHVIGEQRTAVGGDGNRSLLIDGISEPFTWHRDQCVQVRPFRPADEDLAEARHRAQTGGL